MKRVAVICLCVCFIAGVMVAGCGPKKASSSTQAIDTAKAMETVEAQKNYLIEQAKAFYNSDQFQEAVDVAQYVLTYLDKESQQAKDLLEKAKADLVAQAKKKVDEAAASMKDKLGSMGK